MTDGLLDFLKTHDPASTFYPATDEVKMAQRLFDGWKFVVLEDSGLSGDQVRFWMFNQVLYWDPALALVLTSYRKRAGADTSAALRPEGEQLHEHMARAFGYKSTVSHCVLIAHLLEPLVKRYDDFNAIVYPSKGHDKHLNGQHWIDLLLQAIGKVSVIQDVCRCMWSYDPNRQRHLFPADLHGADERTSLHWLVPQICKAAKAGIPQLNLAPVTQASAATDGLGHHFVILGKQILDLKERAHAEHS